MVASVSQSGAAESSARQTHSGAELLLEDVPVLLVQMQSSESESAAGHGRTPGLVASELQSFGW